MNYTDEIKNGIVLFKLSDKIMSCSDAFPLIDKLKKYLGQGKKNIIMDFSDVPWMNSQGVAMIVWAVTTALNENCKIVFSGFSEQCAKVLKITRIIEVITSYSDLNQAMDHFANID